MALQLFPPGGLTALLTCHGLTTLTTCHGLTGLSICHGLTALSTCHCLNPRPVREYLITRTVRVVLIHDPPPPSYGDSKLRVVELRGKDQSLGLDEYLLANAGMLFDSRSIFDPVMESQSSKFGDFFGKLFQI